MYVPGVVITHSHLEGSPSNYRIIDAVAFFVAIEMFIIKRKFKQ